MELDADAWLPLVRYKQDGVLLMPILALCGDAGRSVLSLDAETDAKLLAEAPDIIPACVFGIRQFWRERADPFQ